MCLPFIRIGPSHPGDQVNWLDFQLLEKKAGWIAFTIQPALEPPKSILRRFWSIVIAKGFID
jgi:hypothetical protein